MLGRQDLFDAVAQVFSPTLDDHALDAIVTFVADWLVEGHENGGTVYEEAERIADDWREEMGKTWAAQ